MRSSEMAKDLAHRAADLSGFEDGSILATLAEACAAHGEPAEAREWMLTAVEVARDDQERARRAEALARLTRSRP